MFQGEDNSPARTKFRKNLRTKRTNLRTKRKKRTNLRTKRKKRTNLRTNFISKKDKTDKMAEKRNKMADKFTEKKDKFTDKTDKFTDKNFVRAGELSSPWFTIAVIKIIFITFQFIVEVLCLSK